MRSPFKNRHRHEWLREPHGPPVPGWTVDRHLQLYRAGVFPMGDPFRQPYDGREVQWRRPDERSVFELRPGRGGGLRVPRTVARDVRRQRFRFRTDAAFRDVVLGCAPARSPDDLPWICGRLVKMFVMLHQAGVAHSFEAWRTDPATGADALVGGVYGVSIGGTFFAESMFHAPRDRLPNGDRHPLDGSGASSAALVALAEHLAACGYTLMDIQMTTPHTRRFAPVDLTLSEFLDRVGAEAATPDRWLALGHPSLRYGDEQRTDDAVERTDDDSARR